MQAKVMAKLVPAGFKLPSPGKSALEIPQNFASILTNSEP
jgi:hypothetical protein